MPRARLVGFTKTTLLPEFRTVPKHEIVGVRASFKLASKACADLWLKSKVRKLQMDWLRSENLKEVKVATAPRDMIAG